jgi:hypothetical protein
MATEDEVQDESRPTGPTPVKVARAEIDAGKKRDAIAWLVAGFIMALLLLGLVYSIKTGSVNGNIASANGQQLIGLKEDVTALRQQFTACKGKPANTPGCSSPVVPEPTAAPIEPKAVGPKIIAGPAGPTGATGATGHVGPGPTPAQVAAAVTQWCNTTGKCSAPGPTAAQVAAAVAQYCNARGQCTSTPTPGPPGPSGKPGTNGKPGEDGKNGAKGEQGDPPTSDQIAAAVISYCANQPGGSCVGETGPAGPTGASGPAGPVGATGDAGVGILKVTCDTETEEFQVWYTDHPDTPVPVKGSDCVADIKLPPTPPT